MEELEHSLFITDFFNKIFGKPLAALLGIFGIQVENPEHLVPDHVLVSIIVALFLILFFGMAARKPQLVPRGLQNILEFIIRAIENLINDIIINTDNFSTGDYSISYSQSPLQAVQKQILTGIKGDFQPPPNVTLSTILKKVILLI